MIDWVIPSTHRLLLVFADLPRHDGALLGSANCLGLKEALQTSRNSQVRDLPKENSSNLQLIEKPQQVEFTEQATNRIVDEV